MSNHPSAAKHYAYYPDDAVAAPWMAYGFRPFFLILPWYVAVMMLFWGGVFSGVVPWVFSGELVAWHGYELLYGIGMAGIAAFVLTGVPELFPGVVPVVGRKLMVWVGLWLAGRVSLLFAFGAGVWLTGIINLAFSVLVLGWAFKPVVLDPLQRHASIAYTVVVLSVLQAWFFVAMAGVGSVAPLGILKLSLGAFMVLIVLALRRINMEAVNETLGHEKSDDVFVAKAYRYNLAVFCITLFTAVEFFMAANTVLGWLGLGAGAALLGIINDFRLEYTRIIFKPIPFYLALTCAVTALGYGALGADVMWELGMASSLRHVLTTGAFGLAFLVALIVITTIHTGRALVPKVWMHGCMGLVMVSTLARTAIAVYPHYFNTLNTLAVLAWVGAFLLYLANTHRILRTPRADGILG